MINIKITGKEKILEALKGKEKELHNNLLQAIKDTAEKITSRAKWYCPIVTGRLRSSIDNEIVEAPDIIYGIIGTGVDYAKRVHGNIPYLRTAQDDNRTYLKKRLERAIKETIKS